MKKTLLAGAIAALATFNASALTAGDLAFTAFNADEDGWSMVALADIAANSTVFFTDNEWSGIGFNGGESYSSWSSGAGQIDAGTVIRFSSIDSATLLAASVGSFARQAVSGSSNYGISAGDETVYAYIGSSATATPTTFLAAISNGAFETAASGSLANTGLSVGSGAVQLTASSDYAEYAGARSGQASFAEYKALVSNVANWNVQGDGSFAANLPNTNAFTISPVPEPESFAMLLAGLGVVATMVRRRKSA